MTEKIPLVDLRAQYDSIRREVDETIAATLNETAFIMGSRVTDLETAFAAYTGAQFGIGVSSATCGLHLVLHALGIGPGDEVLVPSHTFIATAEAVCHCGATPVFIDILDDEYTMDPEDLERMLSPATKAVMPVHIFGHCARMSEIVEMTQSRNIPVVEDAAQAHGAWCEDGRAGSMGDAAVFSFYPGKNLGAFGDGGMITTCDPDLYQRMHMLANHGRTAKYTHELIGFNYRLDALQAAVVRVKLNHLDQWNRTRNDRATRYNEAFRDTRCICPEVTPGHVFHIYALQVAQRDRLLKTLNGAGIGAGVHYPIPCHMQPCFKHLPRRHLTVTERVAPRLVSLPLFPEMEDAQQDRIIELVKNHCETYPLM